MARTDRVGLDVGVDPLGTGAGAVQMLDKAVYAKVMPSVVKLYGIDKDGQVVGEFSGFQHGDVIVSAGHALGRSGKPSGTVPPVARFRAVYVDGFEEDVLVDRPPHPLNVPDLILLKGSRSAARFAGFACAVMEAAYAFGYAGGERQPSCSKGAVANVKPGAVAITARADNGFSGGPVVDTMGRLVGVVKEGMGSTLLRVGVTHAYDLHTYLVQAGRPGLE